MSEFTEGDRVTVIDPFTNELRKGIVRAVYSEIKIAIVEFASGYIGKVSFDKLSVESKTKVREETSEPVETSEIIITPEEFQKIAVGVITEESLKGGPLLNAMGTILVSKLHKALFRSEVEND